jgi:hypothetical protein
MRRSLLGGVLFLVFSVGCSSIQDLSQETYRRGFLAERSLADEPLAVLPMWAKGETREYLPAAERIFVDALKEMRPNLRLLPPGEILPRLRTLGIESEYRSAKEAFTQGRVAREEDLRRIGQALKTRFVLETVLDRTEIVEEATQIRILAELWDVELGNVIWRGTGGARGYLFLIFPRVPASMEQAVEVASRGLIKKLP